MSATRLECFPVSEVDQVLDNGTEIPSRKKTKTEQTLTGWLNKLHEVTTEQLDQKPVEKFESIEPVDMTKWAEAEMDLESARTEVLNVLTVLDMLVTEGSVLKVQSHQRKSTLMSEQERLAEFQLKLQTLDKCSDILSKSYESTKNVCGVEKQFFSQLSKIGEHFKLRRESHPGHPDSIFATFGFGQSAVSKFRLRPTSEGNVSLSVPGHFCSKQLNIQAFSIAECAQISQNTQVVERVINAVGVEQCVSVLSRAHRSALHLRIFQRMMEEVAQERTIPVIRTLENEIWLQCTHEYILIIRLDLNADSSQAKPLRVALAEQAYLCSHWNFLSSSSKQSILSLLVDAERGLRSGQDLQTLVRLFSND